MKPLYPLKTSVFSLLFIFLFLNASAQDYCGFDQQHRQRLKFDPEYKKAVIQAENNIKTVLANKDFSKINAPVYTIPVVVHVIHNGEAVGTGSNISDAQIQSAITSLSQFYRGTLGSSVDVEVQFQLATLDPNCNPTTGINRINGSAVTNYSTQGLVMGGNDLAVKNLSRWDYNYYNIWVVSEINGNDGGGGVQGFAYFPGAPKEIDGTVILASSFGYDPGGALGYALKSYTNLNLTLVHEMGHAFNLYHTFEGDDPENDGITTCPGNTTCTAEGDRVCDTDPHRRSNSDCPAGTNACSGNPNDNIIHNFMDYSSEACRNNFTSGQVSRMRAAIVANRPSLINSMGLNSASPVSPYTPPVAAAFTPQTVNLGGGSYAGVLNFSINGRTLSSEATDDDNGYIDGVNTCMNLFQLVRGATYTFSSTILAYNNEQFGLWIDYNNDGDFADAGESIAVSNHIPAPGGGQNLTVSASFTVPGTAPLNTVVRLRVMDELSVNYGFDPVSAAASPEYGQAEDYPVYFTSLLPMVWENFNGQLNGTGITLNWNVSDQNNSKGFEVHRSYDGVNFTNIGFVPATTNAAYTFRDPELPQENNYYRLKQVDLNDGFEFSRTVLIKSPAYSKAAMKVLKNPFHSYIDLAFQSNKTGRFDITLMDVTGKVIVRKYEVLNGTSRKRIDFSGHEIKPGVYIIEVRSNSEKFVERILKE